MCFFLRMVNCLSLVQHPRISMKGIRKTPKFAPHLQQKITIQNSHRLMESKLVLLARRYACLSFVLRIWFEHKIWYAYDYMIMSIALFYPVQMICCSWLNLKGVRHFPLRCQQLRHCYSGSGQLLSFLNPSSFAFKRFLCLRAGPVWVVSILYTSLYIFMHFTQA